MSYDLSFLQIYSKFEEDILRKNISTSVLLDAVMEILYQKTKIRMLNM